MSPKPTCYLQNIFKWYINKYLINWSYFLRWHFKKGFIAIPGSTNPDNFIPNFDIWNFKLKDDEMIEIAKHDDKKQYYGDYYNEEAEV